MSIRIYWVAALLIAAGCSTPRESEPEPRGPSRAQRALEFEGFTDIEMAGYQPFMCGERDSAFLSEGFSATNANGVRVEGMVCCGFFKGCTIRW
jgi:hypothetical protein